MSPAKKTRTDPDADEGLADGTRPEPSEPEAALECPICGRKFQGIGNALLNQHVDECLNKGEVRTVLANDKVNSGKAVINSSANMSSKDGKTKKRVQSSASSNV